MQVKTISSLVLLIFLTACTQTQVVELPSGISLLNGIDPAGFQSPIWSPDGKKIIASYVIESMPDIAGLFGTEPRHEIILIDPKTGDASLFLRVSSGNLEAEAWSPDSQSFAMFWSDGPDGNGVYAFRVDDVEPIFLSKYGGMSPDWKKVAAINSSYLEISDINSQNDQTFKTPANGFWNVSAWSPDMKQLTLIYRELEEDRFENIYLFDLDSGSFAQFTRNNKYFINSAAISPNGKLIAYIIWRFTENDIENKLLISRLDHSCEWTMPLNNINYFAWSPDSQRMLISGDGVYIADLNIIFGSDLSKGNYCP
ncbi:MAG: PD40 domain-containing protein [Chloroflexi bacterium]|nr:PD40 domain-containing protein [Chloroflexota bacterium]